jgi:hypothetical protein
VYALTNIDSSLAVFAVCLTGFCGAELDLRCWLESPLALQRFLASILYGHISFFRADAVSNGVVFPIGLGVSHAWKSISDPVGWQGCHCGVYCRYSKFAMRFADYLLALMSNERCIEPPLGSGRALTSQIIHASGSAAGELESLGVSTCPCN